MAIDPDMEPILEAINIRLDALEASTAEADTALREAVINYNARFYAVLQGKTGEEMVTALDAMLQP